MGKGNNRSRQGGGIYILQRNQFQIWLGDLSKGGQDIRRNAHDTLWCQLDSTYTKEQSQFALLKPLGRLPNHMYQCIQ